MELLQLELKERSNWSEKKQEELQNEMLALESELHAMEKELEKEIKEKADLEKKV